MEIKESTTLDGLESGSYWSLKVISSARDIKGYIDSQREFYESRSDEINYNPVLQGIRPFLNAVNESNPEADFVIINGPFGRPAAMVVQSIQGIAQTLADPQVFNKRSTVNVLTAGMTGGKSFVVTELTGTEEYRIDEDLVNDLIRSSHEVQKIKSAEYLKAKISRIADEEGNFTLDNHSVREAIFAGVFASLLPDVDLEESEIQPLLVNLDENIAKLTGVLFANFIKTPEQAEKVVQNNKMAQEIIQGSGEFVNFILAKWRNLSEDKKQNGILGKLMKSGYFSDPSNFGDLQSLLFLLFEASIGSTTLNAMNSIDLGHHAGLFKIIDKKARNQMLTFEELGYVAAMIETPVDLTFRNTTSKVKHKGKSLKSDLPSIISLKGAAKTYLKKNDLQRDKYNTSDLKRIYNSSMKDGVRGLPWFNINGVARKIRENKGINMNDPSEVKYFLRNCSGERAAINIGEGVLSTVDECEILSSTRLGDWNSATSGGFFEVKGRIKRREQVEM